MASSQVVSLRLSLEELEFLQYQQLEGESIAATIKRLVFNNTNSKPQEESSSQGQIEQLKEEMKAEILEAVNQLIEPLRDVIIDDREKLERLANTVNDILEYSESTRTVNTVNTVNSNQESNAFESMTKAQLQRILKDSGIRYSAKATKNQLAQLCLTKNFGEN